jgi:hypothetical protein
VRITKGQLSRMTIHHHPAVSFVAKDPLIATLSRS